MMRSALILSIVFPGDIQNHYNKIGGPEPVSGQGLKSRPIPRDRRGRGGRTPAYASPGNSFSSFSATLSPAAAGGITSGIPLFFTSLRAAPSLDLACPAI